MCSLRNDDPEAGEICQAAYEYLKTTLADAGVDMIFLTDEGQECGEKRVLFMLQSDDLKAIIKGKIDYPHLSIPRYASWTPEG